jgi:hypothetical protein
VLAVLGVLLIALGGFLHWKSGSAVGTTMLAIGGVSLAAGAVAVLALTNGAAAWWAFGAAVFAALAALGPPAFRPGTALVATGLALICLDVVLTRHPMWLSTFGIVLLALGGAALLNGLARAARKVVT